MKVTLRKKLSKDGWIKLSNEHSIKVDYPTREQYDHLETLIEENKMFMFYKYLIKYTIKDWKGLEVECKLKNNELHDELWDAICYNVNQVTELALLINKEIEFLDVDLKK